MSPLEEKKKREPTATADKETEASESEEEDSDQTVPDPPPEAANAPPTTATAKAGTPAEGLSRPSTPERGPEKHRPSTPERGPGKQRHRTPERGRRKTTPERYHRDRRPERGPERKPRDRTRRGQRGTIYCPLQRLLERSSGDGSQPVSAQAQPAVLVLEVVRQRRPFLARVRAPSNAAPRRLATRRRLRERL